MRPDKVSYYFAKSGSLCLISLIADAVRPVSLPSDASFSTAAMHASHAVLFGSLLSLLLTLAVTQSNRTFCNRLYHSSIVVHDRLYVDGGELRMV